MKYLLDSDTCIFLIRHRPPSVIAKLRSLAVGDVGVSTVTVAELTFGVEKSQHVDRNRAALAQFLAPLLVADFTAEAAAAHGRIRAHLERAGTPIGSLDTLIAAQALSLNAVLVTHNLGEFERVPRLRVESWATDLAR